MSGVQTTTIRALNSSMEDALIIAVVIMKQAPRTFASKKKVSEKRGVFNLTLRDSPRDIINCTVWGSETFITGYDETFHVGDVVNVVKPRISIRNCDRNDSFQPHCTSTFSLAVNQGVGEIVVHDGVNYGAFMELVHCQPAEDYLAISNVLQANQRVEDDNVNLLVAVREVKPIKEIKTRTGKTSQCRDVIVMDQTSPSFLIQLWEPEFIDRAGRWRAHETVLFLFALRVRWSGFHRTNVGALGPRSLLTEDPRGPHVDALRQYARSVPPGTDHAVADQLAASAYPDPATINTVMSLAQVSDRAVGRAGRYGAALPAGGDDGTQFGALVFAMITHLDLDGTSAVLSNKCARCRGLIKGGGACDNPQCPGGGGTEPAGGSVVTAFDMRICLSDHTCTLTQVRLGGAAAEKMFGCTMEEFQRLEQASLTELKWRFMLERCAVRLLVMKPTAARRRPILTVLDCALAHPNEVLAKVPVY